MWTLFLVAVVSAAYGPLCTAFLLVALAAVVRPALRPQVPEGSGPVEAYYRHTTDRDYALLRWATGEDAMHTRLLLPPLTMQGALILAAMRESGAGMSRVLEVGCGRGADLVALAAINPTVAFLGLDLLEGHVAAARATAARAGVANVAFLVADARTFVPDAPFDVVFGCESLCHMASARFLRHVVRRLLPPEGGGRLVMVDAFRSPTFHHRDRLPARMALQRAEAAFQIAAMPSRRWWYHQAAAVGLRPVGWQDLTAAALPFWESARWAALLLRTVVPACLVRWYAGSAPWRASTANNLRAAESVAMALRGRAAAEYGLLVLTVPRRPAC